MTRQCNRCGSAELRDPVPELERTSRLQGYFWCSACGGYQDDRGNLVPVVQRSLFPENGGIDPRIEPAEPFDRVGRRRE